MLDLPLEMWVIYALTSLCAFVVSGVLGIGGPLLLLPLLLTHMAPAEAIAMTAPVMLAHSGAKLGVFVRELDRSAVLWMALPALPLAVLGAQLTHRVDGVVLEWVIAVVIVAAVIVPRRRPAPEAQPDGNWRLLGWGAAGGGIAGFSGTAGPILAVALRGRGLVGARFVGTLAALQLALQVARLPTYLATGSLPSSHWPLAGLLALTSVVAVFIARPLLRRLDPTRYRRWLDGLLLVVAIFLFARASLRLLPIH